MDNSGLLNAYAHSVMECSYWHGKLEYGFQGPDSLADFKHAEVQLKAAQDRQAEHYAELLKRMEEKKS